jgi:4-O-beta-D-mannosyl-D-glucose phosphorylase
VCCDFVFYLVQAFTERLIMVFNERYKQIYARYEALIGRKNLPLPFDNGVITRYENPVLTAEHVPPFWKYDFQEELNPYLMERFGINSVFNAGAIYFKGKYVLVARVEGKDRKSFFAIAESDNGIDNFVFRDFPVVFPELEDGNLYDMRLTAHEDGWIYGLFCTERKDPQAPVGDESAAIAQCGIVRTRNLEDWERLPDLITPSPQQRNVVLHPVFFEGKYMFYTRPQDGFIEAGKGGGIAVGFSESMENARVFSERLLDKKLYHTISETKNGQGPPPLKTRDGWLHLAHGVRHTAAGLRYVLYLFMTALDDPTKMLYKPAGYFLAPEGEERVGDVSNVLFSNGWICREDGTVYLYYASSDTRMHVATSSLDKLVDYCKNTPSDGGRTATSIRRLRQLIESNLALQK